MVSKKDEVHFRQQFLSSQISTHPPSGSRSRTCSVTLERNACEGPTSRRQVSGTAPPRHCGFLIVGTICERRSCDLRFEVMSATEDSLEQCSISALRGAKHLEWMHLAVGTGCSVKDNLPAHVLWHIHVLTALDLIQFLLMQYKHLEHRSKEKRPEPLRAIWWAISVFVGD
jgi:hypothetical protein